MCVCVCVCVCERDRQIAAWSTCDIRIGRVCKLCPISQISTPIERKPKYCSSLKPNHYNSFESFSNKLELDTERYNH